MIHTEEFQFEVASVVQTYGDMVFRLSLLHTNCKYEAEDVFQDVFMKLMMHQKSIRSEEHLKAWLIRVTLNQCISLATSSWKKKNVFSDRQIEIGITQEPEDYSDIYEAVKHLPVHYKEVIHLYYYEELSIQEIATILHRSKNTVKSQMSRARIMLKDKLKGVWSDDTGIQENNR